MNPCQDKRLISIKSGRLQAVKILNFPNDTTEAEVRAVRDSACVRRPRIMTPAAPRA